MQETASVSTPEAAPPVSFLCPVLACLLCLAPFLPLYKDSCLKVLQTPLIMLLVAVALGSAGQLALKIGMGRAPEARSALEVLRIIATQPYVTLGMSFYAASSLMYLRVIQKWDLSLVYPMVAMSYVLVTILSWALLSEKIPPARVLGLLVICIGVSILAISGNGSSRQSTAKPEKIPAAHVHTDQGSPY
jgi:drug/metabolite transporter (DMT)-like permease